MYILILEIGNAFLSLLHSFFLAFKFDNLALRFWFIHVRYFLVSVSWFRPQSHQNKPRNRKSIYKKNRYFQ